MAEAAKLVLLQDDPDQRLVCSHCNERTGGELGLSYLFERDGSPEDGLFELRRGGGGFEQRPLPPSVDVQSSRVPLAELVRTAGAPAKWKPFSGGTVVCVGCRYSQELQRFDLSTG
jgi:hypothetical protein